jgi:hypothetical protein
MTESFSTASGAKIVSDAAALSLIDIRRIDRAAGKSAKRGDLTDKLKRQPNGEAPPPEPATVVPEAAPIAAPLMAPAPSLPPRGAVAAEPAPPPVMRRAVALPEPYVAPEPEAEPPPPSSASETPRAAPLPYDDLRSADDLIYYWDELRAGRALPLFASLDRTRIAISWPDTVMVNYGEDQAAMPQIARLSRLTGAVEFTSMVTEWILSCSRQVARIGRAMETKRVFAGGPRSYHLLLLPFANSGGASDHVLCHLSCAD